MDHSAIRHARARLGLTEAGLAALLGVDLDTLGRWQADPDRRADAAEAPPWVGLALRALFAGFQPPDIPDDWLGGTMTGPQLAEALYQLGIRQTEFARILGTSATTVRKWCARPGASTARRVNPVAARLAWWALHGLQLEPLR